MEKLVKGWLAMPFDMVEYQITMLAETYGEDYRNSICVELFKQI
jgi:hypothetical protein